MRSRAVPKYNKVGLPEWLIWQTTKKFPVKGSDKSGGLRPNWKTRVKASVEGFSKVHNAIYWKIISYDLRSRGDLRPFKKKIVFFTET